jgi:hypothetical protein
MGSLYDYGVPAMATGLTNLFNAVSADKARQAQINAQKIEDTVKLNALKKDMEQEERLNKYINVQGLLTSQGLHPDDAKSTIEEWRSMGWVDDGPGGLPRMQVRNAEAAFKHLDNSPKWKIAIAQRGFQRAQNFKNQINEEQQKILEKDPVFGYKDEKYTKLEQQKIAIDKEIATRGKQIEQAQLLFDPKLRKTDTSLTEAEILSRGGEAAETYIKNKNRLQKDEAAKMQSEIGKLQADRNYYIEQGYTANDPLIQAIDNKIKTSSGMEQTQNQKEMSDLRKETQEFKIQQKRAEAKNAYDGMDLSMDRMIQQAEGLKNSKALPKITGVMGMIPDYPGSEASYARAQQRNLIYMKRMDTMTTLRAMSKTGGLVGNVSDAEGKVFETYIANLENKIGTEDFKTELQKVIDYSKGIKTKLANAYKTQFPAEGGDSDDTPPPGFKNTGKHYNGKEVWTKGAESWVKP